MTWLASSQGCPMLLMKALQIIQVSNKRLASVSNAVRPVFLNIIKNKYANGTAVKDSLGQHSYNNVIHWSTVLSQAVLAVTPRDPTTSKRGSGVILNGERVAILCPNNVSYIISTFAAWMSGCTVVPLCRLHPLPQLEYVVRNSQCSTILATRQYFNQAQSLAKDNNLQLLVINEDVFTNPKSDDAQINYDNIPVSMFDMVDSPDGRLDPTAVIEKRILVQKWSQVHWRNRRAMVIYTSGTTGPPKGVVFTFGALQAQIMTLVSAWGMTTSDVLLHVLPLHHFHGLVVALGCSLWCGAVCVMESEFHSDAVWDRLLDDSTPRVNLIMAVPTVYVKLIESFEARYHGPDVQAFIKAKLMERIRLMVIGSAAMPQPVFDKWEVITGHRLLERYGMTELGMVLSNPLHESRIPGSVGKPLPSFEVRICARNSDVCVSGNSRGSKVTPGSLTFEGDLQVKGSSIFKEYWKQPEATAQSFTKDGWFKTGDTASYEDGVYRILGRTSVDIIKSGGYKISALDVERHLLVNDSIKECAVVGVPDVTWGQRVAAVVVTRPDVTVTLSEIRTWGRDCMAPYAMPTELKIVDVIPRNVMGKIDKKQLLRDIFDVE